MHQSEAQKHPNVKRYTAPVPREQQADGIDFERAYKTLMQSFIDAHVRHKLEEIRKSNRSHHSPIAPSNQNLIDRKETVQ